jgi:hypothetical protein
MHMSTKRERSGKATSIRGRGAGLEAEEEKVVRMRYGLPASDDTPLPQKGEGHPDVLAKLREIERRAFEMTGRSPKANAPGPKVEARAQPAPRAQTARSAEPAPAPKKRKIIDALKGKAGSKAKAKVSATASAKSKKKR